MEARTANKRGGDLGGSPTVRRVILSPEAAAIVRNACQIRNGAGRQRKEDTNKLASAMITHRYEPLRPALPWLEEARRMCIDPVAAVALESVITTLRSDAAEGE